MVCYIFIFDKNETQVKFRPPRLNYNLLNDSKT